MRAVEAPSALQIPSVFQTSKWLTSVTREQPSKSKRIQDYLRANPQARNRDIVKALLEFGVTAADVSNAKAQLKKKYTRRRSRAAAAVVASVSSGESVTEENSSISLAEIEATMEYVQSVGGIVRAQQLLALFKHIQQMK